MNLRSTPTARASRRPLALIAIAALGVGVACTSVGAPVSGPAADVAKPQSAQAAAPASSSSTQGGTIHWLGPATASVAVEEYGDFQWPGCKNFALGQGRQLQQTLVQQGQVRFAFRQFAFLGQESTWAAEASECAADQGKFWEYHDRLFETQVPQHNVGNFSKANLKSAAAALGLDAASFGSCLDGGKYASWIQKESQGAQQRGVAGTPWVFINGNAVRPAPGSFDQLQTAIRQSGAGR